MFDLSTKIHKKEQAHAKSRLISFRVFTEGRGERVHYLYCIMKLKHVYELLS